MKNFNYEQYLTYWALQDMIVEDPTEGEVRADPTIGKSLFCWTKISVRKNDTTLSIMLCRDFVKKGVVNYQVINVTKTVNEHDLGSEIFNLQGQQALDAIEQL